MKRISFLICLGLATLTSLAQPKDLPPKALDNEEIIKMQTDEMISWLKLEGQTRDRFVTEYTAFRDEIDAVAKKARPSRRPESEEEIDKAIQQNFVVSEQILNIRKKYYPRFKEFMLPSQIQMMYRFENKAGRRMHGGPEGFGRRSGPDGFRRPDADRKPDEPGEPGEQPMRPRPREW